mgnify:CR=1 FL=1
MVDRDDAERRPVPAMTGVPEYYLPPYYYEDEIDLRDYVNVLLKYWWLVVGVPLLALIVAGIYGFLIAKPGYQATALVAITSPRYIVQFAPEFETVPLNQRQVPLKAYPTLATSGELLQRILPKVSERLPEEQRTVTALRSMVSAKSGQDASIIELTVSSGDPELAAFIANIWADDFAAMVEEVYGQSASEIASFEEQLQQAEARRQAAEQAVIAFQARNPSAVLQAQLQDKQNALNSYLATQRAIERVVQDAKSLKERLAMQAGSNKATLGDDLSALMLEVNSLSSSVSLPLQLQIQGSESLSDKTVAEQIAFLDNLVTTLAAKTTELDAKIAAVQPELLSLQRELETVQTEQTRLEEERSIARDLYHSLTLKLEEARLGQGTNGREVQVAARALPPTSPSSPRKMMMLGIAGALGLMVGVFAAFTVNFFASAPKK